MNSHLYRDKHKTGQTLYDKLRLKYTDEEILVLIQQSVRTSTSVGELTNEHSNASN
jgi:hypothetical protein